MAEIVMVEVATVADWIADGSAALVDVREPLEFAQARIGGAISVPLSEFDPAVAQAAAQGDGKKLVIHCLAGRRCGTAAEFVDAAGFEGTVYRMEGGLKAWHAAGLPLDTQPLAAD